MQNPQETAARIKLQAKIKKVVLKEMLQSLDLGINTISDISCGKEISYISFARIAEYLDCSTDYFLGKIDYPNFPKQAAHTIFSNNSDVQGGIGNNSQISISGASIGIPADEQLSALLTFYAELDPVGKAELLLKAAEIAKRSNK